MGTFFHFSIVLFLSTFSACSYLSRETDIKDIIPYQKGVDVHIDGNLNDWHEIETLFRTSQFTAPWGDSSEVGPTTFNAFSDGTWLYFSFKVDDTDIVTSNEFQVE